MSAKTTIEQLLQDEVFVQKILQAAKKEEVVDIFKAKGYAVTEQELENLQHDFSFIAKEITILPESELEKIAGGEKYKGDAYHTVGKMGSIIDNLISKHRKILKYGAAALTAGTLAYLYCRNKDSVDETLIRTVKKGVKTMGSVISASGGYLTGAGEFASKWGDS